MSPSHDSLQAWVGRTEQRDDIASAAQVDALNALLDHDLPEPRPGDALPPLAHWLHFTPRARQGALGGDGHAERGGFLPPVGLPRRMWAGGELVFHRPLRIGHAMYRRSRIAALRHTQGRSGALVFVTVEHLLGDAQGLAITERQDLVFREPPLDTQPAPEPQAAPPSGLFSRRIQPDPVLLFRYSALTFNGHRIHYDQPYATGVEGYPGLLVHGPLIATLLVDLVQRHWPAATLRRFSFRAMRPLFVPHDFTVCCAPTELATPRTNDSNDTTHTASPGAVPNQLNLWARDRDGWLAMQASAELSPP